jgi:ElaB/YqjD/DUF883 family membrane-anchored ribosome-binding protein
MFSTSSKAEQTAEQAWEYLTSAMSTAGDTAAKAASVAGDKASKAASKAAYVAGDKASRAGGRSQDWADEAWRRANAAADALAGRRPGRPWGTIVLAGLAGVAVGWATAAYARRALARQAAEEEQELAQTAVIVTGER